MNTELNQTFSKYFNPVVSESSKVNTEICKKCGGKCCKATGCHISPFDLKEISVEFIINLIDETGCISIDWWDGNPITNEHTNEKAYFLRIKNQDSFTVDPTFGGICSILTDIGCPLSFEYRPRGARDLVPSEGECQVLYSKQECAIDWYAYHDIMEEVYWYYFEKGDVSPDNPLVALSCLEGIMDMLFGIKG